MSLSKRFAALAVTTSLVAAPAYASVIDRPFFQVAGVVIVWGANDFGSTGGANTPVVSDFVLLTPAAGTEGADLITEDVYSVVTGKLDPVPGNRTATTHFPTAYDSSAVSGQTSGGVLTHGGAGAPLTSNTQDGVLDSADSLTSFGLGDTTTIGNLTPGHQSSFYVASNQAFDIYAETTNTIATGDFLTSGMNSSNISFSMSIQAPGLDWTSAGLLPFGSRAQDPSTGGSGINTSHDSLDDFSTQVKLFDGGRKTALSRGSITEQSVRFDSLYQFDMNNSAGGVQGYDFAAGVGTLQADVTYTVFVP